MLIGVGRTRSAMLALPRPGRADWTALGAGMPITVRGIPRRRRGEMTTSRIVMTEGCARHTAAGSTSPAVARCALSCDDIGR
jgi:hypothetical protein